MGEGPVALGSGSAVTGRSDAYRLAGGDPERRGIACRLTEQLDTGTPGGRLTFHIFGALTEFERDVIVGIHIGVGHWGRVPSVTLG